MYLNGFRVEDATAIIADIDNSDPHAYVYADGISGPPQLGAYLQADAANLASALAAFISEVGYPWIAVGDLSSMTWTNGTHGILAINLDHASFGISDSGTGIAYSGIALYSSFGYAPGSDFATAQAAIKALQGNITWSPSS
jgi:hypothetical protein